jgi:murein DD-endopeptidase MepM/ murein hydrolase activator NlpD
MFGRSSACSALVLAAIGAAIACRGAVASPIDELPPACEPARATPVSARGAAPSNSPALQLEILTPFEPTAFPMAGRNYVIYELHLHSFDSRPLTLRRIDVLDAESGGAPVAVFEGPALAESLEPQRNSPDARGWQLAGNGGVVAFMCVAFDGRVPNKLSHRVQADEGVAEGPTIGTRSTEVRSLGPPVRGAPWQAEGGLDGSQHRVGLLVVDGRAQISRRYALDWHKLQDNRSFIGDENDLHSYYAYDEDVLAVADGTVVNVIDGIPDSIPGIGFRARPRPVPMTPDTVAGNVIVLDLGGGQFATYFHLQAGSLLVKQGDRVRRGQVLARIGSSGDTSSPHLHFQVTTTPSVFAGEGIPYVIDSYRVRTVDTDWETRANEFPLIYLQFDFGDRGLSDSDRPARATPRRTIRTEQ